MSSSLNSLIAELVAARARCRFGEAGSGSVPGAAATGRPVSQRRRALLLALAAGPLCALPAMASANSGSLAGLNRWGSGEFRRFGFLVYEATLWAGDDPMRPPLALRLDYKRNIEGKAIAEASAKEMRRFVGDENLLQRWGEQMQQIFPDVKPGDHLLGIHDGDGASFYQDTQRIGVIDSAGFADAFFAIWLDSRTSVPELRAALLRRKAV